MTTAHVLSKGALEVHVHRGDAAEAAARRCLASQQFGEKSPSRRPEWLAILREGLSQQPYCIEARRGERTEGLLPLAYLQSVLMGKFLVGMPYLNVGGVMARQPEIADQLITRAVALADELDVRYLELRHETRWPHPALNYEMSQKVHMRLDLPADADALWRRFKPKVRNQIRKAEEYKLSVEWGGENLLHDFYRVFSVNMRDLGTPVFSRKLFAAMLARLGHDAEICVVRRERKAVAAAILIYGEEVVEVPSASSLRRFNHLNANMLMYWHLLQRGIERRRRLFDFGRSSQGSGTYRFKAQWGAQPHPAVWQYYVRQGSVGEMRPDNPKQQRRIAVWRRLPVWLTRLVGPPIIRGIP